MSQVGRSTDRLRAISAVDSLGNVAARAPQPRIVEARDVVKVFRRASSRFLLPWSRGQDRFMRAVDEVSFHIAGDEIMGLVGESGSGKTTLGKSVLRLYDIDEGEILLEGRNIHGLERAALKDVRPRYQMVFQNPLSSLNPGMRVWDMLAETVSLHLGLNGLAAAERIADILYVVQLTDKGNAYPSQLSGGERRRVGLARVLLLQPKLVVADEPTSGLDASLKAGIINLMLETRAPGSAYLLISHDLHLVRYVANRVMVMLRGRLVETVPEGQFELGSLHHPYTVLLLKSLLVNRPKSVDGAPEKLSIIEDFSAPEGQGCFFYSHCPIARKLGAKAEACRTVLPPLAPVPEAGDIACHFPEH